MLAGVLMRGTVATQGHAAFLTGSQVNPFSADLDAFGAFHPIRAFDLCDGIKMRTIAVWHELNYAGAFELVHL
jgi:hypothetical protein